MATKKFVGIYRLVFNKRGGPAYLLVLFTVFQAPLFGQSPGRENTIEYINGSIGPEFRLSWGEKSIIVIQQDDAHATVREDRVESDKLDLAIYHDEENSLLCIPCMADQKGCVTRTIVAGKKKRTLDVLTVPVTDNREFYSVMKAFEHLIRLTSENEYKERTVFE